MIAVGKAAEVRRRDRWVIDTLGIPGTALMETASRAVALSILEHHAEAAADGTVVVCGSGNNGGDGYGCARWLHQHGVPVSLLSLSSSSKGDAAVMRSACVQLGVPEVNSLDGARLIVDAVFGTGLSREITGHAADVICAMNDAGVPVVAVDIPSGVDADTGAVHGVAVVAERTVTFGYPKVGMFGEPGTDRCGDVELVDIGLGPAHGELFAELPDAVDLGPRWPRRLGADHKTRSGHLGVVAGSAEMAGAAVLACRGALAAGVGLVTLFTPTGALARLEALPPEVMIVPSGSEGVFVAPSSAAFDRMTAILAGPGMGGGHALPEPTQRWLVQLWQTDSRPVAFDADALPCAHGASAGERVLTPHPGEAARMLERTTDEVQADRFAAVIELSQRGVALLKGRHTLIGENKWPISVNSTGGPVLATAGSGDVLGGIIGALLARGVCARDAAILGAWVHGAAGDRLASVRPTGWTATDIAAAVPDATAELLGDCGQV